MASGVGEANRFLAQPRFARRFPFCRSGPDCLGFGGHMAERQVGRSDTLDVPHVWIYGRDVSQRSISARRHIDCNTQLHAGDRNSRSPKPTGIVFPGSIRSRGAASFGLEGRNVWRWRVRSAAPLPPGAVQVGKVPEALNESLRGIHTKLAPSIHRSSNFLKPYRRTGCAQPPPAAPHPTAIPPYNRTAPEKSVTNLPFLLVTD